MPGALQHDVETVRTALAMLSYHGNVTKAAEALRRQGLNINQRTLSSWRQNHPELWDETHHQVQNDILTRVADRTERFIVDATEAEHALLEQLMDNRDDMNAKELSNALRNISVSKSLAMEKIVAPVRGRPTVIVEHKEPTAIIERLNQLLSELPQAAIDSTAEELPSGNTDTDA